MIQLTDLTPTLLRGETGELPGAELQPDYGGAAFPDEFDVAAQTVRSGFVFFFIALIRAAEWSRSRRSRSATCAARWAGPGRG